LLQLRIHCHWYTVAGVGSAGAPLVNHVGVPESVMLNQLVVITAYRYVARYALLAMRWR
jgi:hypothetical protein